jgi:peptide/nickel transport system ATP-binding protein
MPVLNAENIKAYYHLLDGDVQALEGATFTLEKGEVLGIAGESGCGKSTLAATLSTIILPPLRLLGGRLLTENGDDIFKLPERTLRREIRGKYVALVPQSAMNALNPTKKIKDLVTDAVSAHYPKITKREVVDTSAKRFDDVGLPSRVLESYSFELSGGMKQRTVIALSSLMNPRVLIADEPTSALDVSTQKTVLNLLVKLRKKGIVESVIFITHDIAVLRQIADRIIVMYAGVIVEIAGVEEIIFKPLHPYSKGLMPTVIVPDPEVKKRAISGIPGAPPNLKNPPAGCRFHPRCASARSECGRDEPPLVNAEGRLVRCWLYAK